MVKQLRIVGLGEALWDVLPGGKVLGGAPLNVACHAHRLLGERGDGVVASRVGTDVPGDEVVHRLARRGMASEFVQRDVEHPTSTVNVALEAGQPTFTFSADIAWDHLEFTAEWAELARQSDAVCFGTLAQRSQQSRVTIWKFLDTAPQAIRLFDVNLREGFYDREAIIEGCRRATIVKLNDKELKVLAEMLELPDESPRAQLEQIRDRLHLDAVVFTRGEQGTLLVDRETVVDPRPVQYEAAAHADAVGAGDACSAGVLVGWLLAMPHAKVAELANHLGAYVASQPGATPELPPEIIRRVG